MAVTETLKNLMLDSGFTGTITMSLHTADPSTDGSNELTGGSYSRQTVNYASASSGVKNSSVVVTFESLPAGTITHVGFWSNTTFLLGATLTTPRTVLSGDGLFFAIANIRHVM